MENKILLENIRRMIQCPKCGSNKYKRFKRRNYPFGKKSTYIESKGKQCKDCNFIVYEPKKSLQERKWNNRRRR